MSDVETAQWAAAAVELAGFLRRYPRVAVVTGAGCSTASGIGDYRDETGRWKHSQPVMYADFMTSAAARQRYWARSLIGWPEFSAAAPNSAHRALVALETQGMLTGLITQNVDRLHQRAGHQRVLDLHGRLDRVCCMECSAQLARTDVQRVLLAENQDRLAALRTEAARRAAGPAPDGDAELGTRVTGFVVPDCPSCGGILKPDVVFYGQSVPKPVVQQAYQWVAEADALLVVGSSLMVFSSFRFCRAAAASDTPIAILNRGVTRADDLATLKLDGPCGPVLESLERRLRH